MLKDYFKLFRDVVTGDDEKDPWPTLEDLERKDTSIFVDSEDYMNVLGFLENHRFCLIEGAEDRGKTTLARVIGFNKAYIEKWYVAQVDASRVADVRDLAPFIKQIEEGTQDKPETLIIIEDCHMKPEVIREILKTAEKSRAMSFLFTMRIPGQATGVEIEDLFEGTNIRENNWVIVLEKDSDAIYKSTQCIVDIFVRTHSNQLQYKLPDALPSAEDYSYLAQQTEGNKKILTYYLDTWLSSDDTKSSLQEIDLEAIYNKFNRERLRVLEGSQLETLLAVSAIGQFEVPIIANVLFDSDASKIGLNAAIDDLNELKGLAFRLPWDAWLLADTESRLTLETMAYYGRIPSVLHYTQDVLKTYIKGATNYFQVLASLKREQERELILLLIQDQEISDSLSKRFAEFDRPIEEIVRVLQIIYWANEIHGVKLWSEYKKILGADFIKEIERKLWEENNLVVTSMLIAYLKKVDIINEAIPLVDALPTNLFVAQVRNEASSISAILSMIKILHNIIPEKCKQILKSLDRTDYMKIGEKGKEKNLIQIMWFLIILTKNKDEEMIPHATALLEGLGQETIVEKIPSSNFDVVNNILKLIYAINIEKCMQVLNDLSEADYLKLGEAARYVQHLQNISWFLRKLTKDNKLRGHAKIFLTGMGEEALIELLRHSDFSLLFQFIRYVNKIDHSWVDTLLGRPDFPVIDMLNNSTIKYLENCVLNLSASNSTSLRNLCRTVVQYLSSIYENPLLLKGDKLLSVKQLGRLLSSSKFIDENAAKMIAIRGVELFESEPKKYTLEELAYFIRNSRWSDPYASHRLVDKVLINDANSLLVEDELNWFTQVIWESIISNRSRTNKWLASSGEELWVNLLADTILSDTSNLLLVIWQANEEVTRKIIRTIQQEVYTSPDLRCDPNVLPLLGLFTICGLKPPIELTYSPTERITELFGSRTVMRVVCSLLYLQESRPGEVASFIGAALSHNQIASVLALLLSERELPWSASIMQIVLHSYEINDSQKEADEYRRLILYYRASLSNKLYFGTFLKEICIHKLGQLTESISEHDTEIEHQEEKIMRYYKKWLNFAIDKEVFTVITTKNPYTFATSRLIQINLNHDLVVTTLHISNSMLLALKDAQRIKGYAVNNEWDTALFTRHIKGDTLSKEQLNSWKKTLLMIGVVEADYQMEDKGKWIVAFHLNSDHPLTRAIMSNS